MKNRNDFQVYDLTTEEGYKGFNEQLDNLESKDLSILDLFGLDSKKVIETLREIGDRTYNQSKKEKKQEEKKFNRPSDLLDVNKKLQIHKIVEEYINTMIKPFNNGKLTDNQINDAYAGLFEFACWIMNK
jgi:hypothetical protein